MRALRSLRLGLAAGLVLASAVAALAQDYTVSSVAGQWVTPPATANDISSSLTGGNRITTVNNLPFPVPYYGQTFTSMAVTSNGYVQFGGSYAYPYPSSGPLSGSYDGICAAAWGYLYTMTTTGTVRWWTDGTAPNRRLIVAWTSFGTVWSTGDTSINVQIQFNETSGRITMAYNGTWTAQNYYSYAVCVDEYNGNRFSRPPNGETSGQWGFTSSPPNDWQFDPRVTNFTGTVLYNRYVVDSSGIGNSVESSLPLADLRVELRNSSGGMVAATTANASGAYAIRGLALNSSQVGSIAVVAQTAASVVRNPPVPPDTVGVPHYVTIRSNVAFNADLSAGTVTIDESNDPGGSGRIPLHIARTIHGVWDWARARSGDTISQLDVYYDTTTPGGSSYTRQVAGSPVPASMRISGVAGDPDGWDSQVIRKTYARHVLASIASAATTSFDARLDAVTDAENAFAEGFGYFLDQAVAGVSGRFVNGASSSSATVTDLESPALTTAPSDRVAGWVAAGLYDLLDAANESWDTFDGASVGASQVFATVDAITVPVTSANFYATWGLVKGYSGTALARIFVRHGLVGDDADEPNDSAVEAFRPPQFGFVRTGRVLNLYNEDWYVFTLPADTEALTCDVTYNRATYTVGLVLELRNAANAVIATGSYVGATGPLRASTGPMPAGQYKVRVAWASGNRLDDYTLQAFARLTLSASSFRPWTVGRPYNVPVQVGGGVPPYELTVPAPFVPPPGLYFDAANLRVTGTPQQAGQFNFMLTVQDSTVPPNSVGVVQSFVVNPPFRLGLGEFIAFAHGKNIDQVGPYAGGTPPFSFVQEQGALPSGLAFAPGEFRFVGVPDVPGSSWFDLQGTDVAGSTDTGETTGVVCVAPDTPAALAEGKAASGFYFDGVAGTIATLKIATAKKQPKRPLRVVVLDADGTTVLAAKTKSGKGSGSMSGFVCPSTGRFYLVVAADEGPATELAATPKIVADPGGAGSLANLAPGTQLRIPIGVLAGAEVAFKAKAQKGSGLRLKVAYLFDPAGNSVPPTETELVRDTKGGLKLTKTFGVTGTWTLVLAAEPGASGGVTWSYKIKEPAGAVYSAD